MPRARRGAVEKKPIPFQNFARPVRAVLLDSSTACEWFGARSLHAEKLREAHEAPAEQAGDGQCQHPGPDDFPNDAPLDGAQAF